MVSCTVDTRGRIHVTLPISLLSLRGRLKEIDGWDWNPPTKTWTFPAARATAQAIVESFSDIELDCSEGFNHLVNSVERVIDDTAEIPIASKLPPWPHQKRAFWFVVRTWAADFANPYGGAMLALDMGCVDAETEYLSPDGWRRMDDYYGGPIAQVDASGIATFVEPERYIIKPSGPMVKISHGYGLNMVLSLDHRLALERHGEWKGPETEMKPYVETVQEALDNLKQRGPTAAKTIRTVYRLGLGDRPGVGLSLPELRVMVAVMADGHFPCKTDRCYVRLKKQRKIERLRTLLCDARILFDDVPCKPEGFRVFRFEAPLRLKSYPTDWYQKITNEEVTVIADEVFHWDGSVSCRHFYSTKEADADFIQWVLQALGHVTSKIHDGRQEKGCWRVMYRKKNRRCFTLKHINEHESANGQQYCFTVPNGFFVARRKNCIFVTGNCGKTKVAIDLIQNYDFSRTLVVCPAKVIPVWPHEFRKHCTLSKIRVLALQKGTTQERAREMLTVNEQHPGPLVVIVNYEATRKTTMYRALNDAIKQIRWDLVVADEVHRIKAPGGKDSRFFKTLGTRTACRLGLTGTPMPRDPLDLYGQFRFLDASIFGNSYARFRSEYAIMVPMGTIQIVNGFKNQEDLTEKFSRIALQIRAEDVFPDLPDEHHIKRPIQLSKDTMKPYQEMDKDFVTWVGDGVEVTAQNTLVKLLKLQELTGGFLRDPDTKVVTEIGTEKLDTLLEILEDLPADEPVAIACRFRPEIDRMRRTLANRKHPISCSEISGKYDELEDWKAGKTRVLLCQVQSAKEGIDCTRARYVILNSIGFSPGDYNQFLRRFRRPGQKAKTVTYIHLAAQGTIDDRVYKAIERKEKIIEAILREVRG